MADDLPRSAAAIRNRTSELVFGQPLTNELAQLERLRALDRDGPLGWLRPELRRLARLDVQIIDGDDTLTRLDPVTKVVPQASLLEHLREEGRAAAAAWLERRGQGEARSNTRRAPAPATGAVGVPFRT